MGGLAIFLGAAAIYYCFRYKKATVLLAYEMNDIRNMAHISTTKEVLPERAESYSHLTVQSEA